MLNIPPRINTSLPSLRNLLQLILLAFVAVGCLPRYRAGTLSCCSHLPLFTKLSLSKLSPFWGRLPLTIHLCFANLNLSIQNDDLTFRLLSFSQSSVLSGVLSGVLWAARRAFAFSSAGLQILCTVDLETFAFSAISLIVQVVIWRMVRIAPRRLGVIVGPASNPIYSRALLAGIAGGLLSTIHLAEKNCDLHRSLRIVVTTIHKKSGDFISDWRRSILWLKSDFSFCMKGKYCQHQHFFHTALLHHNIL